MLVTIKIQKKAVTLIVHLYLHIYTACPKKNGAKIYSVITGKQIAVHKIQIHIWNPHCFYFVYHILFLFYL